MTGPSQEVTDFLASKKLLWTPETIKATASRLSQWSPCQDAVKVYSDMVKGQYSAYYIKITFISLAGCTDWLMAQGRASSNNYRRFLEDNSHLFRNAYQDKYATITWAEYQAERSAADPEMRYVLDLMAKAGLRLHEIYKYDGRTVVGKGGKLRTVFLPPDSTPVPLTLSEHQIRRRLKHNPHSYRKLFAYRLQDAGVDVKTIMHLMGHSSLTSTQRYLRPKQDEALRQTLEAVWRTA